MKAVILAAGKGTRLYPFSEIMPKSLMPITIDKKGRFKTIIEYLIEQIHKAEIEEIIIIVNYKAEMVMNYLKDGSDLDVSISYVYQSNLDGNGGAFYQAQYLLGNKDVLISDCDNYIADPLALEKIVQYHRDKSPAITVGVSRVQNVEKFAIIKTREGKPVDIKEKPKANTNWGNLAKSGIMILSPGISRMDKEISLTSNGEYTTTQIIKYAIDADFEVRLFSFENSFFDIGTWNEYIPVFINNIT